MLRILRSVGAKFVLACVLACLCAGDTNAGCRVELIQAYEHAELMFDNEAITIADCVFARDDEALWLLSSRRGEVYKVAKSSEPTVYIETDTLKVTGSRVGGMWGSDSKLFFSVSGRNPELLEYDISTGNTRRWPQTAGIYDLALSKDWTVVVPIPAKLDKTNRILVYGPDLETATGWGERCPPEFGAGEPILKLACLNKVAMGSDGRVYIASLNTGRCEILTLADLSVVSIRDPDPNWTMPTISGDNRLSTDTMLLDIAVGTNGNELFVLTSPKGIHGQHTLEVYLDGVLIEEIPLADAFGSAICGPGGRIALVKDEPPARIDVYHYEVSP